MDEIEESRGSENETPALSAEVEPIRPPVSAAAEIDALVQHCCSLEPGTLLTFDQIAQIIREDPRKPRGRSIVIRAKAKLITEHSTVFSAVRGVGIKREDNTGIVHRAIKTIPAIRRSVLRGKKIIGCVDANQLDAEGKQRYILVSSTLGVLTSFTSPKFLGKLELKCVEASHQLPPKRVLKMFLGPQQN